MFSRFSISRYQLCFQDSQYQDIGHVFKILNIKISVMFSRFLISRYQSYFQDSQYQDISHVFKIRNIKISIMFSRFCQNIHSHTDDHFIDKVIVGGFADTKNPRYVILYRHTK